MDRRNFARFKCYVFRVRLVAARNRNPLRIKTVKGSNFFCITTDIENVVIILLLLYFSEILTVKKEGFFFVFNPYTLLNLIWQSPFLGGKKRE